MTLIKRIAVTGLLLFGLGVSVAQADYVGHVIHISIDGLHPDAITALGPEHAPNFFRLQGEGAFTDNARTDPKVAYTLANHASQYTGRHTVGDDGHGWVLNDDPGEPITLHLFKSLQVRQRIYIASVFDVVHDHNLSTALYANNSDFEIFHRSWRDKIDTFFSHNDMMTLAETFVSDMAQSKYNYAFLHLREPDSTGHREGWMSEAYLAAVKAVDGVLGMMFGELVDTVPELMGNTVILLTADHAGEPGTTFHVLLPPVFVESGIVPFYVWGPPGVVATHVDLYQLNVDTRAAPGPRESPSAAALPQPIRNGDAANLALDLLGLPSVLGSVINVDQDLAVR